MRCSALPPRKALFADHERMDMDARNRPRTKAICSAIATAPVRPVSPIAVLQPTRVAAPKADVPAPRSSGLLPTQTASANIAGAAKVG